MRFYIGLGYLALVCLLGLRALGKIPVPAYIIVALAWFSLGCDIMCYAVYAAHKDILPPEEIFKLYAPIEHLYALFEFFAQLLFVYMISKGQRLRRSILIVVPVFFAGWVYSQFTPGIVNMKNEPAIFFATSIANAYILMVLRTQAKNVSEGSEILPLQRSILRETLRQLFLSEVGKIFIGLFIYNLFQLSLFFVILGIENISHVVTQWIHSFSLALRNTLIAVSFIQSIRKGTDNA
jgi:hypothetical protein